MLKKLNFGKDLVHFWHFGHKGNWVKLCELEHTYKHKLFKMTDIEQNWTNDIVNDVDAMKSSS
jgi:hypothetical protein